MGTKLIEELCCECNGTGYIEMIVTEVVTREMAIDAGDPQLEGQTYRVLQDFMCEACGGSGIITTKGKDTKDGR